MNIKREFVFATYVKSNMDPDSDLLVVKEHIHQTDGSIVNNLRMIKDYQRPFYITKPDYQNHEDKKEYEFQDRLNVYYSTQAALPKKIFNAIEGYSPRGYVSLYDLGDSPYLYGSDITTPVLVAKEYRDKEPDINSPASLAIMDFETDVLNGTEKIISGSITSKTRARLAVTRDFLGPETLYIGGYKKAINDTIQKYLGKILTERGITEVEIAILDDDFKITVNLLESAHAWGPDFLGFWNMSFDMGKMLKAFTSAKVDPANYFSDPSIPREFRYFNWREDNRIKTTADGKQSIKHIADLWHTVRTPASFYCIDLMSLFKRVRGREQQRNSYSLDNILKDELDLGKLRFKEAEGYTNLEWHRKMQRDHKLEYLAYNLYDCISVEQLDEKTNDVSTSLRTNIGTSELSKMASNPKRLSDDMHHVLLADNKVIGSTSKLMSDELDNATPSKNGWIQIG